MACCVILYVSSGGIFSVISMALKLEDVLVLNFSKPIYSIHTGWGGCPGAR